MCFRRSRLFRGFLLGCCWVLAVAFAPARAADLVDFESDAEPIFLSWDPNTYTQAGYVVTFIGAFGMLGTAADQAVFGFQAAQGNGSRFLSSFDAAASIQLERMDGGSFDLVSFDAAFVSDFYTGSGGNGGGIYAIASLATDGSAVMSYADFVGDTAGGFPFTTYSDPGFIGGFTGLSSLRLFACAYDAAGTCASGGSTSSPVFAIDNLLLASAVPEAPTWLLLCAGGAGLLLSGQRRRPLDGGGSRSGE